jgi:hypothetical protein
LLIIVKSSFDRDNNYCHYVIQRIAGLAITLYYHPAGQATSSLAWLHDVFDFVLCCLLATCLFSSGLVFTNPTTLLLASALLEVATYMAGALNVFRSGSLLLYFHILLLLLLLLILIIECLGFVFLQNVLEHFS